MVNRIWNAGRHDTALVVAGIAAAAFAFCSALFLSSSVTNDLEKLQRFNNHQRVQSVVQGVDQDEMHLIDYTKGYAMWDDTYSFLETRDPAYLAVNYAESVMAVSPADLVAIYDLDGRMIFSAALGENGKSMPPPEGLVRMAGLEHFQQLRTTESSLGRVEWIGDRPYLIAVCPVTDSSGKAPIRGYFLFGTVIGEKMLRRLEKLTGVEISVMAESEILERGEMISAPNLDGAQIMIPEGDIHISNAEAVFREDNAEQQSVVFKMKLPERTAMAGAHLSRVVRIDFLLVSAAFALFVFSAIREVRRRRKEIQCRIAESEELREARDQAGRLAEFAESADRAKSSFLAMMSHEIRTPLNAIMGYAQLLEDRPQDKDTAEGLTIIKQSGVVLQRVLNDILDFSKIEAGKLAIEPQVISLRKLVAESSATFRNQAESKGNHISVETNPDVPEWILADGTRLKQVIYNLLSNAVKFTDGGAIVISILCADGPFGGADKSFSGNARWIRISIRDEGIGVSEADEKILFEPFSQIDSSVGRRYDGTGLGLAISRRLCHLMGGDIVFERPEKGSVFTVSFPAEDAVTPDAHASGNGMEAAPPSELPRKNLRILVVDDNLVNARLLAAVLKKFAYDSEVALSGAAAVDFVQREQPDLIFMDIQMPGIDGLEATRRIREIEAERGSGRCQIVAVTADILDTNRTSALAAGMDGYLSKPVKLERIEEVLAGASSLSGSENKS